MSSGSSNPLIKYFGSSFVTQQGFDPSGAAGPYNYDEPGIDIALSPGTSVRNVQSGYFNAGLSTPNEAVISTPQGINLDYMHIATDNFSPGQFVPAGMEVGTVSTQDVTSNLSPVWIGNKEYFSNAPHLEFGVYSQGETVGVDRSYGGTGGDNPITFLQNLMRGGGAMAAQPPGSQKTTTPIQNNNQQQWAGSNIPIVGGFGDLLGNAFSSIGNSANTIQKEVSNPFSTVPGFNSLQADAQTLGSEIQLANQTSLDFFTSADKISKWLPTIVIIIVLAAAIGIAKHGL